MTCPKCGRELDETDRFCPSCGARIAGDDAIAPAIRHASTYEYTNLTVPRTLSGPAADSYACLGWEFTGSKEGRACDAVAMSFRRSRGIGSRAQLMKMQRRVDDLLATIERLDAEKSAPATRVGLAVGIPGLLVFGAGLAICTSSTGGLLAAGVATGIVGATICAVAALLSHRRLVRQTEENDALIARAYDDLAVACEEADAFLRGRAS